MSRKLGIFNAATKLDKTMVLLYVLTCHVTRCDATPYAILPTPPQAAARRAHGAADGPATAGGVGHRAGGRAVPRRAPVPAGPPGVLAGAPAGLLDARHGQLRRRAHAPQGGLPLPLPRVVLYCVVFFFVLFLCALWVCVYAVAVCVASFPFLSSWQGIG